MAVHQPIQPEARALPEEDDRRDGRPVRQRTTKTDWKDYIAIAVAMLVTILLPIVVALGIMAALVLVLYLR